MISFSGPTWQIQDIKAVLFDKDGTFIDSHLYWGEIIRRRAGAIIRNYCLDENLFANLCAAMGLDLHKGRLLPQGPIALVSRDEVIRNLRHFLETMGVHGSNDEIADIFVSVHKVFLPDVDNFIRLIPGCTDFFTHLYVTGVKMGVVTSDTVANTVHTLKKLGIQSFFDCVVGMDSTKEPKETGVPASKAIRELGVSLSEAVCVGDAPVDLVMARECGCKAGIGVATGQVPIEVLRKYSPYVALSMQDIITGRNQSQL